MGLRRLFASQSPQVSAKPMRQKTETRTDPSKLISQGLMQEIDKCVTGHHSSERVLYSDDSQSLQVVGESFRGDAFQALTDHYRQRNADGEIDVWFSGVLLPEPSNQYDPHAIMVVLFDQNHPSKDFTPLHVGYIDREDAGKHQSKIIEMWKRSTVIPLLIRVKGGTSEKPNYGILAKAKTSAIRF